jgi:hypothetical protein
VKLFDVYTDYDYGWDGHFTIGQFKNFNILDVELHTSEYWSWEPDIRLTFEVFAGTLFTIRFSAWSLSFDLNLISYRCPFNLSHTRDELYFDPFE